MALVSIMPLSAQETTSITGYVLDETGEPLIGASVMIKGTTTGVITDINGMFTLETPSNSTLTFSYIGFSPKDINLSKRKKKGPMKVRLLENSQELNEVVVTAMGIKKDTRKLGYAVSSISSEDLIKAGATNFASAMYGKAPGVRINQTQGGSS